MWVYVIANECDVHVCVSRTTVVRMRRNARQVALADISVDSLQLNHLTLPPPKPAESNLFFCFCVCVSDTRVASSVSWLQLPVDVHSLMTGSDTSSHVFFVRGEAIDKWDRLQKFQSIPLGDLYHTTVEAIGSSSPPGGEEQKPVLYFVSHRWNSAEHPDDEEASQLAVLKQLYAEACEQGTMAYFWYDYCSVPQKSRDSSEGKLFNETIQYLHDIIYACDRFVILPGTTANHHNEEHVILHEYFYRGWCFAELFVWLEKCNHDEESRTDANKHKVFAQSLCNGDERLDRERYNVFYYPFHARGERDLYPLHCGATFSDDALARHHRGASMPMDLISASLSSPSAASTDSVTSPVAGGAITIRKCFLMYAELLRSTLWRDGQNDHRAYMLADDLCRQLRALGLTCRERDDLAKSAGVISRTILERNYLPERSYLPEQVEVLTPEIQKLLGEMKKRFEQNRP